jgi:hypothetical protein
VVLLESMIVSRGGFSARTGVATPPLKKQKLLREIPACAKWGFSFRRLSMLFWELPFSFLMLVKPHPPPSSSQK